MLASIGNQYFDYEMMAKIDPGQTSKYQIRIGYSLAVDAYPTPVPMGLCNVSGKWVLALGSKPLAINPPSGFAVSTNNLQRSIDNMPLYPARVMAHCPSFKTALHIILAWLVSVSCMWRQRILVQRITGEPRYSFTLPLPITALP